MDWLYRLFGFRYLLNMRSAEVHDLDNRKTNCKIEKMSTDNKRRLTQKMFDRLRAKDKVNGCRWCLPHLDTDKRKWRKPITDADLKG